MTSASLLLARHGQTVRHAENRYAGVSDVALTDTGYAQAEAVGRWAAAHPVDAARTSPLSRAIAMADPACRVLGLTPHREPGLRECDFGVVEGRTLAEFAARNPEALSSNSLPQPSAGRCPQPRDATPQLGQGVAVDLLVARVVLRVLHGRHVRQLP
ncbi:histidine phosphatase family protein, partial [Streptomyces sp. NPDC003233]